MAESRVWDPRAGRRAVGGKIDTGLCQTETWAGARPAWRVDELIWDMWETKAGPGSPTDLGWRREERTGSSAFGTSERSGGSQRGSKAPAERRSQAWTQQQTKGGGVGRTGGEGRGGPELPQSPHCTSESRVNLDDLSTAFQ